MHFFYLHADEQGETRSGFHWQTCFPSWRRGKGNCLPNCPHQLTSILGGSGTGEVKLRLDRWVPDPLKTEVKAGRWSTGKYYAIPRGQGDKRYLPSVLTNI